MAKQLNDDDYFVRKDVINVLSQIGTDDHIPALQKLMADSKPNVRRQIEKSIEKIEARVAAEAKKKSVTGKKKKPKAK